MTFRETDAGQRGIFNAVNIVVSAVWGSCCTPRDFHHGGQHEQQEHVVRRIRCSQRIDYCRLCYLQNGIVSFSLQRGSRAAVHPV